MTDQSPILGLPYLQLNQAQKHVTVNEALQILDAVAQLAVGDRDLTVPPVSPEDGARYIVGAGATGGWTGRDGMLAEWANSAWAFHTPVTGWLAWVSDEAALVVWDGSAWQAAFSGGETVDRFGVNTTADATNRLAVKSDAVLMSHDDVTPGSGDIRVALNKAAAANSATMVFQSDWSGRAEMGLSGDDDWHLKVSADGSAWTDALVVDAGSGHTGIGVAAPQGPLHVAGEDQSLVLTNTLDPGADWTIAPGRSGIYENHLIISTGPDITALANHQLRLPKNAAPTFPFGSRVSDGQAFSSETSSALAAYKPFDGTRAVLVFRGADSSGKSEYRLTGYYHDGAWHSATAGEWLVDAGGARLGIGKTGATCTLDVAGPARVGQFTVADLPSAGTAGAGAIVYVSDEAGGATLAFSDGSAWRRAADRAVVS